jgi:hypothetical protein
MNHRTRSSRINFTSLTRISPRPARRKESHFLAEAVEVRAGLSAMPTTIRLVFPDDKTKTVTLRKHMTSAISACYADRSGRIHLHIVRN